MSRFAARERGNAMPKGDTLRLAASPIVCLPLVAPASDDRTFNGWADFLSLLPLISDRDAPEVEAAAGG